MTFNYEDALNLKSMEMAQECCTDDKSPKQYCTRITLELFHRRKTISPGILAVEDSDNIFFWYPETQKNLIIES